MLVRVRPSVIVTWAAGKIGKGENWQKKKRKVNKSCFRISQQVRESTQCAKYAQNKKIVHQQPPTPTLTISYRRLPDCPPDQGCQTQLQSGDKIKHLDNITGQHQQLLKTYIKKKNITLKKKTQTISK